MIPAAIDGELDKGVTPRVSEHLTECPKCLAEFELERATKSFVKRRLKSLPTPEHLREKIKTQLSHETIGERDHTSPVVRSPRIPSWRMMLALGGGVAIILLLLAITPTKSRHSHSQPDDDNVIHQTYNNFDGILDGKISPQIVSDDPIAVNTFLETRANFRVNIPRMKEYKLIGGVFSQYKGQNIAHLIYKHNRDCIYLYQVKLQDLFAGKALQLPREATDELLRTGWYFENHMPDCSLIVWFADSTVCCAVADITRDKLLAYVKGDQ
ncbi:MAG: hypothetical protein HYR76_07440 [Ignavibacteria bacterium]|nr:hypothetical protein [Ignavibacteria bacterium]